MLHLEEVTVRFGDHVALDAFDCTIHDGETLAVVGPSGSGKSTMLRAIAGLEPLASGRITRDGADLAPLAPHRRGMGLMFQDHALFPHRDVLGNVAFGLRMQRRPRVAIDARAREVLALVGLAGAEHRPVRELSGGEQQRVALARALAPEPTLLMLDEPFGSLDRNLRDRLLDDLRGLVAALHQTVVVVTHDHDEAFAVADRVAILDRGRIEQIGPALEVWNRPATAFAAHFLGANVTAAFGGLAAIRPEGLRLDPSGPVVGRVTGHTFRRDHFRVRVELDEGTVEVAVGAAVGPPPAPGTTVRVAADPDAIRRLEH
jgi:thiamine transport system ATP-binding protein